MSRPNHAHPYLTLPGSCIECGPWMRRAGSGEEPLHDRMTSWDPGTTLEFRRQLVIDDVSKALQACELSTETQIAAVVRWRSSATRLRGVSNPVSISGASTTLELSITIPGDRVGGDLDLTTAIVLVENAEPGALSARLPGSVLWSESERVALEGLGARFPIAVVDFGSSHLPAGAAWMVEVLRHDLGRSVMGAVRLLLNSEKATIVSAAVSDSTDPGAEIVRQAIRLDTARAMIRSALSSDELLAADTEFEADTLGRAFTDLLDLVWPGESVESLRSRSQEEPDRFDAELQHGVRFLGQA